MLRLIQSTLKHLWDKENLIEGGDGEGEQGKRDLDGESHYGVRVKCGVREIPWNQQG